MISNRYSMWVLSGIVALCLSAPVHAQTTAEFRQRRYRMVEDNIAREGIKNEDVLAAMRTVPRHMFVNAGQRKQAYYDQALPIGYKQTISPPYIVAYMTEMIDPQPEDKVLEIGTGSGYQAAVLSEIVRQVYTIEIVEQLGKQAARRFERSDYSNITAKIGDGYKGWAEHAPFDKIIVTCSPEAVPQPLIDQLRDGGRMIVPIGQRYQQVFYLFEKKKGKLIEKRLVPTLFVPMTGEAEAKRRVQPDRKNPRLVNGGFEFDANEDGRADSWYYQRQMKLITGNAPQGQRYLQFSNTTPGRGAQALQGMAIDGASVRSLDVSLHVKVSRGRKGTTVYDRPALFVHFYDDHAKPIKDTMIGPWLGTAEWKRVKKKVTVPRDAHSAVIRVGLNGATGVLSVDDVRVVVRSTSR